MDANDQGIYDLGFKDKPVENKLFNQRLSEAIAWEAKGTAFLIIPDDVSATEVEKNPDGTLRDKSAWVQNEFPTLQRNRAINLAVRISATTYPYKKKAVEWKKGSTPTLPPSNAKAVVHPHFRCLFVR